MTVQLVAAVVPCLNEVDALPATCASLGFRPGEPAPPDTLLVFADNGSTDGTMAFAEDLRRVFPAGTVVIAEEKERGYLPPRTCGNRIAMATAKTLGVPVDRLLIV